MKYKKGTTYPMNIYDAKTIVFLNIPFGWIKYNNDYHKNEKKKGVKYPVRAGGGGRGAPAGGALLPTAAVYLPQYQPWLTHLRHHSENKSNLFNHLQVQ